ncbi:hypothetical protein [Candidatus Neoehrlichia procyonis]|uniref:Uncharacterized protein n=1 Tax=Candidatus Neoehrlichia procyonis str. RAC413 TaxID=1359163 RepID=A0A0F3NPB6_9RICK|nr:hypothetical protein [Candidatus Neoehrlichia lotoris]KJV68749.1 hypothetical protein NLO413_0112 [Candidatus Neoehrlichia lotoris str. RAC413]
MYKLQNIGTHDINYTLCKSEIVINDSFIFKNLYSSLNLKLPSILRSVTYKSLSYKLIDDEASRVKKLNKKVALLKKSGILLSDNEVSSIDGKIIAKVLAAVNLWVEKKEKLEQQKIKLRQKKEELGKILKELRDFGVLDNDEIAIMINNNDFIKILLRIAKQRKNSFNEQQDDCTEIGDNDGKEEKVSSLVSEVEVVSSEEILLSIWEKG